MFSSQFFDWKIEQRGEPASSLEGVLWLLLENSRLEDFSQQFWEQGSSLRKVARRGWGIFGCHSKFDIISWMKLHMFFLLSPKRIMGFTVTIADCKAARWAKHRSAPSLASFRLQKQIFKSRETKRFHLCSPTTRSFTSVVQSDYNYFHLPKHLFYRGNSKYVMSRSVFHVMLEPPTIEGEVDLHIGQLSLW